MRRAELERMTKQELLEVARKLDLPRRSVLSKDGLIQALARHRTKPRQEVFAKRTPPPAKRTSRAAGKGAGRAAGQAKEKRAGGATEPSKARARSKATPASKRAKTTRTSKTPRTARPAASAKTTKTTKTTRATRATKAAQASPPSAGRKTPARPPATPARKPVAAGSHATRRTPRKPARTRRATPAAAVRRERSGPFGPATEELHGADFAAPAGPHRAGNGRPAPRAPLGAPLEMPEHYGRDHAGLMARDPYWLYAYWEITAQSREALQRRLGSDWEDHRNVMRVFAHAPDVAPEAAARAESDDYYDIELPPEAHCWYINAGRPDRCYQVAIGIRTRTGHFHALVRSNLARTPRDSFSPATDEEWTTPPAAERYLYEGPAAQVGRAGGSAELGALMRERMAADWSSGMLGSMASGMLTPAAQPERGFWFQLDAELIVYGATEPDATVRVQGREVALRPDGTFSLRFLLPDGTQVIDATATSADRVFRKTITPTVRRETNETETIETEAETAR